MATTAETLRAPPRRTSLGDLIARENRRKKRRRAVRYGLLLGVPLLVAALWFALRPRPVPLPERFRTGPATQGDVVRQVHASGHVEAVTTVQVGAEISGRLTEVLADYNDVVRRGQVLARFDKSALLAQVAQARATLQAARAAVEQARADNEQAQRVFVRAQRLHAQNMSSDAELDNAEVGSRLAEQRWRAAESQLAAQQAAYELAQTNLSHTEIRAPIDGVVVTRNVDPGQTLASVLQTPVLFSVAADLRRMEVVAAVDEADIGEVHPRQQATFTVNAYPERSFAGVVTEVRNSPVIVQDVVTYGAVISVDNDDLALKPGMTATVKIRTGERRGVLRVPNAALRFTPPGEEQRKEPGVWILTATGARHVAAAPGLSDGELTAVTSGELAAGASVLLELTPAGRKAYGLAR